MYTIQAGNQTRAKFTCLALGVVILLSMIYFHALQIYEFVIMNEFLALPIKKGWDIRILKSGLHVLKVKL